MSRNVNTDFAHVRCLNNRGCIFVDNSHLNDACRSFCEKVERQLDNKEGRNTNQKKYVGNPEIEKTDNGFMIGAIKASYYKKNPDSHCFDKLKQEDYCIATSGNFIVEPGSPNKEWLTAPPKFAPPGFDFIGPESGITKRLEEFHAIYFEKKVGIPKTNINTIYGMPFSQFYKYNVNRNLTHPHIPRDYEKRDLPNYRKNYDRNGNNINNMKCAAQQLIVYVGDRVAKLKTTPEGKNAFPVIEICELWSPSRLGKPINRKWPQFSSSCPCKTCKIVLPYLITSDGDSGFGSVVEDLHASLREKYAKKKR